VCTERLEFLDITLRMSPGESVLELLPFAALIKRSTGGSGSRSADKGASSAVASSGVSSSSSSNASRNSCNNAYQALLLAVVVDDGTFVGCWALRYDFIGCLKRWYKKKYYVVVAVDG
jgi:hypothetical protein